LSGELKVAGKKVAIGTGGHGAYSPVGVNNNFITNPALEWEVFLLEDLDLGWDPNVDVFDLTNPVDYSKFKALEDAARIGGGSSSTATIRAWCFSARDSLP
jgi:hypothetical protein